MRYDTYTLFTALLALVANGATLALVVVFGGDRLGVGSLRRAASWLRTAFADIGLWVVAAVAITSTIGSLLYSEYFDLIPCRWCWFQRIAMYPLALIFVIAAIRKDTAGARRYGLPLAAIGAVMAGYHYLIQQFPNLESGACDVSVPCSSPYVWRFEFVSIPYMALAGFLLILAVLLATRSPSSDA
ncbi:MAG: disulfide bond formation protein B [Acidimicrobiia bacterium]|nr:disulfide bond formation protein B [Acidimicrobiia bacterium]